MRGAHSKSSQTINERSTRGTGSGKKIGGAPLSVSSSLNFDLLAGGLDRVAIPCCIERVPHVFGGTRHYDLDSLGGYIE